MTETVTAEDFGPPVPVRDLVRELLPNHPWGKAYLFGVMADAGYTVTLPATERGYVGAIQEVAGVDAAHIRAAWPALVEQHQELAAARARRIDDPGSVETSRFD